jgi:hypothetical protein
MTDWIFGFYCPKVPLSIGTTLGALGSVVPESVFHTRGSNHPITPNHKEGRRPIFGRLRNKNDISTLFFFAIGQKDFFTFDSLLTPTMDFCAHVI